MATNFNYPKNVYICGPWYGENTYDRFKEFIHLSRMIRDRGFHPFFPPVFTLGEWPPRGEYMKHAMVNLLKCQYIYLIRGWQESSTAVAEYLTARFLDLKVLCDEGEFPEELDPCFPPERRDVRTKKCEPGKELTMSFQITAHHVEDNEGFQEYYKNRVLPLFTRDSYTAAAE